MTDRELIAGFLSRQDHKAFEAMLRRHGPMVLRVCRDVMVDSHAAEDAFQATFLVLARRAGAIRDPDALGAWLHGVATRVATRARVAARRRMKFERTGMEVEAVTDVGDPTDPAAEVRPALHAEIARLPESLRVPMVVCYMEGRSYEAAAQRLKLPLGTLKGRLSRGRDLLRSRLVRRGVTVTALALILLLREPNPAVSADLLESTADAAARRSFDRSLAKDLGASLISAIPRSILLTTLLVVLIAAATRAAYQAKDAGPAAASSSTAELAPATTCQH